jgi:hypothetical protein
MSAVFNAAGQRVTCRDCKRTYTCTPETTPVQVIDLSGTGTDPRDLSRRPSGGKP